MQERMPATAKEAFCNDTVICCWRRRQEQMLSFLFCSILVFVCQSQPQIRNNHQRRQQNLRRLEEIENIFIDPTNVVNENKKKKRNDALQISNTFPTLSDTLEMSALSLLVYRYKRQQNDTKVCELINERIFPNSTKWKDPPIMVADDLVCHWYHHDHWQGTQVMVVSSTKKRYVSVVFAGTDDLRTSLADANIYSKPFGDENNFTLPDPRVHVHAGFNNAIFANGVFQKIVQEVDGRIQNAAAGKDVRLLTTGHSLGAANSVLVAVGLKLIYENQQKQEKKRPWWKKWKWWEKRKNHKIPSNISSLSFGCPRIGGNSYWRDYVHNNPTMDGLGVWRFVLGWDLVARLPQFFFHAGHTIQMLEHWSKKQTDDGHGAPSNNLTLDAYYQHYGDESKGLAGVPTGWYAKSYIWVPGALSSHSIHRYYNFFYQWWKHQATNPASEEQEENYSWVNSFVRVDDDNHSDDDKPSGMDDDFYVDPFDDDSSNDIHSEVLSLSVK